ncbi:hypothetical protein VIBHAR_06076 [Vibrio campbellii ATCC BAA-1116]|uniref:Uncharacterized protein n=1 Tax=Vibrio campbellii (strain ATCC BAA-1116) TaxID=2902295 RepID=A7N2C1_VIBC1|nr:hypothetical protein VIBHAR_06076 [Vibrio campbellii ATCC BAA-1116]
MRQSSGEKMWGSLRIRQHLNNLAKIISNTDVNIFMGKAG